MIIGSGPNGLTAAITLARAGLKVLVCEAHPERAGGALATDEGTLPGFLHDVGAGFFPFHRHSPALRALDLEVEWAYGEAESAHPASDGSCPTLYRDDARTAAGFGEDGAAWTRTMRHHRALLDRGLMDALLGPLPGLWSKLRLGPAGLLRLAALALSSGRAYAERNFIGPARRVMPALALHVDLGPDDLYSAPLGYMLGTMAAAGGNAVPVGGAGAITAAMVRALEAAGGELRLGARVRRIRSDGGARVVVLAEGTEIEARLVMADTDAASLYLDLLDVKLPGRVERKMRSFPRGWGTFKVDWALSGPVPWLSEEARGAAVVHTGEDLDHLARFTAKTRRGELSDHPYMVIGQQSLLDPSRAPEGQHTLWAYSRVPAAIDDEGGWPSQTEAFADTMEDTIEALAPGFEKLILGRRILPPPALEAMNPNLVGGDLGGGSNLWRNQLLFRPAFPWFRYATPIKGVYLCSSYAHPGAGVHGMCGYNAAQRALARL